MNLMGERITMSQAQDKMFELLERICIGDEVYELAQGLFTFLINQIEANNCITDAEELDSGEEWYDGIREDFFQEVYDRMLNFLKAEV